MKRNDYELLIENCANFGLEGFEQTVPHAGNKGLPKAGVTSFYDSFVLNRALVFK